jgi:hypothetical protein
MDLASSTSRPAAREEGGLTIVGADHDVHAASDRKFRWLRPSQLGDGNESSEATGAEILEVEGGHEGTRYAVPRRARSSIVSEMSMRWTSSRARNLRVSRMMRAPSRARGGKASSTTSRVK